MAIVDGTSRPAVQAVRSRSLAALRVGYYPFELDVSGDDFR
jgi:hypothetical protein